VLCCAVPHAAKKTQRWLAADHFPIDDGSGCYPIGKGSLRTSLALSSSLPLSVFRRVDANSFVLVVVVDSSSCLAGWLSCFSLFQQMLQQDQAEQYKKWRAEVKAQEEEFKRLAENSMPAEYISRIQSDMLREFESKHRIKYDAVIQVRMWCGDGVVY
jgi:hypothetical protein